MDVSVRRGAECNIDHRMLCTTLRLKRKNYHTPVPPADNRRYDVSSLARVEVGRTEGNEVKTAFIEQVLEKARKDWPVDGSVQEKWSVVHSVLTETPDDVLGKVRSYQPDWFHKSMDLTPPTAEE